MESLQQAIIKRDGDRCLLPECSNTGTVLYKLIHGSLWDERDADAGGNIENNAILLCKLHNTAANKGYFPPQACRMWANIKRRLPRQFDGNFWFTTHGNVISHITKFIYPEIPYLFISSNNISCDNFTQLKYFINKPLVVTVKMDGVVTSLRKGRLPVFMSQSEKAIPYLLTHKVSSYTKNLDSDIEVFAKWLMTTNKIHYSELTEYLQVFAAFSHKNDMWLSWDNVVSIAKSMYTTTVPVVTRVIFNSVQALSNFIKRTAHNLFSAGQAGLVVKTTYPIHSAQIHDNVAKYVSKDYLDTTPLLTGKHNVLKNATGI